VAATAPPVDGNMARSKRSGEVLLSIGGGGERSDLRWRTGTKASGGGSEAGSEKMVP
jgi:hypothetical protein